MNNITIEFCPEDRERIDRLIAALDRKACEKCVESATAAMNLAYKEGIEANSAQSAPPMPAPGTSAAPATPATPVVPAVTPAQQPIPVQPVSIPPQQSAIPYEPYSPGAMPVQPVAPAAPLMPAAPVPSATPTAIPTGTVAYDMDTIARAGAALIDQNPAAIGKLMELLAKYGTDTITNIAPAHYGAFVTDLRALGASI